MNGVLWWLTKAIRIRQKQGCKDPDPCFFGQKDPDQDP